MKYFIFILSLIVTINPIIGMEIEHYDPMLTSISSNSINKPSITLINNDTLPVDIKVTNNHATRGITLKNGYRLTFSPYVAPFFAAENISHSAIVRLNIDPQHRSNPYASDSIVKYYLDLHIGGASNIKFGDSISINHNDKNNTIYILHNNRELQSLTTTGASIPLGLDNNTDNLTPLSAETKPHGKGRRNFFITTTKKSTDPTDTTRRALKKTKSAS